MRLADHTDYRMGDLAVGHFSGKDADWLEVAAHAARLIGDGMELYQLPVGLVYVRGGSLAQRLAVGDFAATWKRSR